VKPVTAARAGAARLAIVAVLVLVGCSGKERRDRADVVAPPTAPPTTTSTTTTIAPTTTTTIAKPQLAGLAVMLTKVGNFEDPVTLAVRPGDDSVYVGERPGRVQRVRADGTKELALDIVSLVKSGGEQGLVGLAFAPDRAKAYVHYSDSEGDTSVDEFTVTDGGLLAFDSRRHVLGQQQPYANHNGGQIEFGPDGYLYIGLGDGGSANDPERRADKLDTLLGKILRIDPSPLGDAPYAVPADNPFIGRDGARPEIFHLGLRNPWRFSFDSTGAMWIGDVGQNELEEVDIAPPNAKGLNFGWSAFEGNKKFNDDITVVDAVPPVHQYEHGDGAGKGCSVTGGYRYRGTAIAGLRGAYVFGDYCTPGVRAIDPDDPATSVELTAEGEHVSAFAESANGELYVASIDIAALDGETNDGAVYRITPAASPSQSVDAAPA
jgi:glucose/arabinose dehydrogenase